jgi:site-specific DNA recombinase
MFQFLASLSELERATIQERTSMGRARATRAGKWTHGPLPYGYMVDDDGKLTPGAEAPVVYDIFTRIAAGGTSLSEADRLNALGIPLIKRFARNIEKNVAGRWQPTTIQFVIKNKVYTGTYVIKSRYGPIKCTTTPIVSEDLWLKANRQLTTNRALPKSNATRTYLLRGLIWCGLCEGAYVGSRVSDGKGWEKYYYRCNNHTRGRRLLCKGPAVPALALETYVWDKCAYFIANPEEILTLVRQRAEEHFRGEADSSLQQQQLQEALAEKAQARERANLLFTRNYVTVDELEKLYREIDMEAAILRNELDQIRSHTSLRQMYSSYYENVQTLLTTLRQGIATFTTEQKRAILSQLVAKIQVFSDHTECHFHFMTDHAALPGMRWLTVVCHME